MNFEKKGNNWKESPPGLSAMTGKEKGLFSMVTQFYIKLKTRIILLSVNFGFFSTVKGAGFDALWACDAGIRTRSVPYYVMIFSNLLTYFILHQLKQLCQELYVNSFLHIRDKIPTYSSQSVQHHGPEHLLMKKL